MVRCDIIKSAHKKTVRQAVFLCALFIHSEISIALEANSAPSTSTNTYLTLGNEHQRPFFEEKEMFDCDDKIFAVAELSHYPHKKYEFTVEWSDPVGEVREVTRYPFHINQTETRLWSWLSLRRGTGANMFKWIDSSAGLDGLIGPWRVKISLDNKKIADLKMEINC